MRVERFSAGSGLAGLADRIRSLGPPPGGLTAEVAETLSLVRGDGDGALLELSERFDGVRPASLRIEQGLLEAARGSVDAAVLEALSDAAANISAVAQAQIAAAIPPLQLPQGHSVTVRSVPVAAAGIYVPGGGASYPSSVLMGCLPARAAGVNRVVVATPPNAEGKIDPTVLAACSIAYVDEVYALGGAQAIAALAFGTESVRAVDVIAGPGSARVQEAKAQVSRTTGIDSYAGPSELMAVLDASAPIDWIALDLCAQAEHGVDGLLLAVATGSGLLDELEAAVSNCAAQGGVGDAPLALVEVSTLESAIELANLIAPEHLQLACEGASALAERVETAGCVFVGASAATAFGDYVAGSNHILPTGGAGRFTGPLGPSAFLRSMSIVDIPAGAAERLAAPAEVLAEAEGFPAHAESVRVRRGSTRPTGAPGKMGET